MTCLEQCLAFIQQYLLGFYEDWRGAQITAVNTTGGPSPPEAYVLVEKRQ